jgi:predicted Zn-dependent protease
MKRWGPLAIVLLIAGGALFYSQRHEADSAVNPNAALNFLADTQRELSRIPMRLTRISDEEEKRIGDQMALSYLSSMPKANTSADIAMEKYVNDVGSAVIGGNAAASMNVGMRTKRHLAYEFHYVPDNNFVNAFALPGGHVFIGKGLISLMDSEDELADVLGHEVEHIDRYHCAERVQLEAHTRNIPLSGLVQLPITIFQAGYSKEQELEADREGTLLATHAGYSAEGAVRMFERLGRMQPANSTGRKGSPLGQVPRIAIQSLSGYFRSHPYPEERKEQIERMIANGKLVAKAERPLGPTTPAK